MRQAPQGALLNEFATPAPFRTTAFPDALQLEVEVHQGSSTNAHALVCENQWLQGSPPSTRALGGENPTKMDIILMEEFSKKWLIAN